MRHLITITSFIALAGCAMGPYAPDYGDATHNNVAVQSVQPAPPPAAQPVAASGALAAVAQDRYVKDQVKPPVSMTTSNVGTGGGGNNGSGNGNGVSSGR
jgi:hypothetical protein